MARTRIRFATLPLIVCACAAALLAVALTGCGTPKGRVVRPDGALEISFWHGMSGKLGDAMDLLVAEFNALHTGEIYVNAQFMGEYNILNQKLIAAVAADMPPDIAQVFESWTDELVQEGIVAPLDAMIDGPHGFDRKDVVPVLLDNVTVRGKIWSLPYNKSVQALYWNKRMFKEAGLDPEKPPATWEELVEVAKKLTVDKDGDGTPDQWGLGVTSDVWLFINLIHSFGGECVTADGRKSLCDSDAAVFAGHFLQDLTGKYKVALRCTGREYQNKFASEDVAMFFGTVVSKVFIEGKLKFPLGMAQLPSGEHSRPGGKAISVISGTNALVFDRGDTGEIEAAFQFLSWFTAPAQTIRWAEMTTYLPVRQSAIDSTAAVEIIKKDPNLRVSLVPPVHMTYEPRSKEWFECRSLLAVAVERIVVANEDPKKVLAETVGRMDRILKDAQYR